MAVILLTGGAGYVGSHACVALAAAGHSPVLFDDFSNAREDVPDRLARLTGAPVPCYRGDVRDPAALGRVLAAQNPDAVMHFAALKAVGESMDRPLDYMAVNIAGLVTLLGAMEAAGLRRLVYSSSATVYGVPDVTPTPESAPRRAVNPYGFTKIKGEEILEQLAASDPRWAVGVLRYFNPAGAHESAMIGEDPSGRPNNLVPLIARVAAGQLRRLEVFGDDYSTPDGTGVRDYIHVMDLAEGHRLSVERLLAGAPGHVLNLGTGRGHSVLEVLAAYGRAVGRELPYRVVPRRPGDVPVYCADPARAEAELGFRARRDLDEICRSSWAWVRGQAARRA
ncbi:UDP-glucose 4-epimerase GalE [Rhodovulum sp. YNF3179]|uniref:UDP-glucose 4-epimerase GalE n=1 Tax=Rhodovulum sp. YNF3179 TaxID=3425127 RepID=UPI003D33000C